MLELRLRLKNMRVQEEYLRRLSIKSKIEPCIYNCYTSVNTNTTMTMKIQTATKEYDDDNGGDRSCSTPINVMKKSIMSLIKIYQQNR